MARQVVTIQTVKTPFQLITAGVADITFAAGDVANGDSMAITGKEILIAHNGGASPYYITVDSVADEKNRQADITEYSLAAGDYAVFTQGLTLSKGWKQTDGTLHINVENAAVLLAAIRIP